MPNNFYVNLLVINTTQVSIHLYTHKAHIDMNKNIVTQKFLTQNFANEINTNLIYRINISFTSLVRLLCLEGALHDCELMH